MNFLLDTYAISETIKPKPDAGYMGWLQDQQAGQLVGGRRSLRQPCPARRARRHQFPGEP
jgi:hypothetical protein